MKLYSDVLTPDDLQRTSDVVSHVRRRLEDGGYRQAGNCFEGAVAAGILMAADPDKVVRLVQGSVRGVPHWWLHIDGVLIDPTEGQFDPPPGQDEYLRIGFHPMDLGELAWLLQGRREQPGSTGGQTRL